MKKGKKKIKKVSEQKMKKIKGGGGSDTVRSSSDNPMGLAILQPRKK